MDLASSPTVAHPDKFSFPGQWSVLPKVPSPGGSGVCQLVILEGAGSSPRTELHQGIDGALPEGHSLDVGALRRLLGEEAASSFQP